MNHTSVLLVRKSTSPDDATISEFGVKRMKVKFTEISRDDIHI